MFNRTGVVLIFTSAYFLSYFYRSTNAVIAGDLVREINLSVSGLGLMTSLFFAAFALIQIPLGICLDRFGPRFVTPSLMMAAVLGSLIFSAAHSFWALAVGRTLIGMGMGGVLMGAFKTLSQWVPAHRYSTISGLVVGLGSTGAFVAATPLAWLNISYGWRMVFVSGAALLFIVAATISICVRNTPPGKSWHAYTPDLSGLRLVFRDIRYWRIAILSFFCQGTLLSFQGLWAGPYLSDVMRLDPLALGNVLLLIGIGVTGGYLASGWLADRFGHARSMIPTAAIFIVSQIVMAFHPPLPVLTVDAVLFGFSGGLSLMLLTQPRHVFPLAITGQATTATNLLLVSGTFLIQWSMGVIIGLFPADAMNHYPPEAYRSALLFTAGGNFISLLFYLPFIRCRH